MLNTSYLIHFLHTSIYPLFIYMLTHMDLMAASGYSLMRVSQFVNCCSTSVRESDSCRFSDFRKCDCTSLNLGFAFILRNYMLIILMWSALEYKYAGCSSNGWTAFEGNLDQNFSPLRLGVRIAIDNDDRRIDTFERTVHLNFSFIFLIA